MLVICGLVKQLVELSVGGRPSGHAATTAEVPSGVLGRSEAF